MSDVFLLSNSSSGSADEEVVAELRSTLAPLGPVTVLEPEFDALDEQLPETVQEGDLLVCAGGDGTLNCALNAFGRKAEAITWGLVPMGTGNDLARTLGLPTDPIEAAARVVEGDDFRVDLGLARGRDVERLFVNACMGGFSVQVDEVVEEGDLKDKLGPFAFWVGGLKAASELERSTLRVEGELIEDCIAVGVGNGRTCGRGLKVFPEADPSDGMLELSAFSAGNMTAALALAAKLKIGFGSDSEGITTLRGGYLHVDSEPDLEFNIDGELVDLTTPAIFEVVGTLNFRA